MKTTFKFGVLILLFLAFIVAFAREPVTDLDFSLTSSKWTSVRKTHLMIQPNCMAIVNQSPLIRCGSKKNLNVHHLKPVHLFKHLEFEPSNLITLCRHHHLTIGHDPDGKGPMTPNWRAYNKNLKQDGSY